MAYIDRKTYKAHAEITVPEVERRSFECDDLIAPLISLLNQKGYKTRFCCSGHPFPHYDEMYLLVYEDTNEAISSTEGELLLTEEFFSNLPVCKEVSLEEVEEGHQFEEEEIDFSRPFKVYYVETDNDIFGSIAYISFEEDYFVGIELPEGWEVYQSEYYDPEKHEFSEDVKNTIIQFSFDCPQDPYCFFLQQITVFMNLHTWVEELPDISK